MKKKVGIAYLLGYLATIPLANWAVAHLGVVPVGFGLMAPAGVYFIGLAFTLRDLAQNRLGRLPVVAAIIVGAALSALISPALAVASGVSFLLAEGADFAVYTPLKERTFLGAVLLSNTVGLIFDSVLFLWLAFHSLAFLPGQIVGKFEMTVLALAVLYPIRRREAVAA